MPSRKLSGVEKGPNQEAERSVEWNAEGAHHDLCTVVGDDGRRNEASADLNLCPKELSH